MRFMILKYDGKMYGQELISDFKKF